MDSGEIKESTPPVEIELTEQQQKLLGFVKTQHGTQKRKYTFEPYWHHLVNVAALVKEHAFDAIYGVEVALCHDLLEDTKCNRADLKEELLSIGYEEPAANIIVADVKSLTDQFTKEKHPGKNRKARKLLEAKRILLQAGPVAQTVKYADVIDNLSTIADRDPEFAKVYISEKEMYIGKMNKGNGTLYRMVLQAIKSVKTQTQTTPSF